MSESRLRVVPYEPGRAFRRFALVVCLLAATAAATYFYATFRERTRLNNPAATIARLEAQVAELARENQQLKQRTANASKSAEVDRLANENVRKDIMDLRDHIAGLEEANSFYRSLMSPKEGSKGLHIGNVEITNLRKEREYGLKVVLQQIAKTHRLVKGRMQVTVDGFVGGEPVSYSIAALSPSVEAENIKIRFKYFQTFTATLTMPEGFTPNQINVAVETSGKKPVKVDKSLAWLVGQNNPRLTQR